MRKACLERVPHLARRDDRVVFIGSDLSPGLLDDMRREFPDRWFMEGIAEQHIVGMAAGMALDGFIPYVNTIATFITRRCYEQVAVDVCMHELPVRLIGNGGGVVYAPLGPTHQAIEDIAIMRALPGMTIVAPADAEEVRRFMDVSIDWPRPIYIRLAKGGDPIVTDPNVPFVIGRGYTLKEADGRGAPILLVGTGVGTTRALAAADILAGDGFSVQVLHLPTVKPIDADLLERRARDAALVVTVEEHSTVGGLGSAVADTLLERLDGRMPRTLRLGIPDVFPKDYGSQDHLMNSFGLAPEAIAASVRTRLGV